MSTIDDLKLSNRTRSILRRYNLADLASLVRLSRRELAELGGLGRKSILEIEEGLAAVGLTLSSDPFEAYTCARHGARAWDVALESLFLCDECAREFQTQAFRGEGAAFVGNAVHGFCAHCNRRRHDVRLRQWYLCGTCNRVVRSIGRSIVANNFVLRWWDREISPRFRSLKLDLRDPPELRPRDLGSSTGKTPRVDFMCMDTNQKKEIFGIELKTGRNYIRGSNIGSKMGQFQLDNSDCDDIVAVVKEKGVPVYLAHAQVIDRAAPPTTFFVAVGLWWTDLFAMYESFIESRRRPRETRIAAYYKTEMFREMQEFISHLEADGPRLLGERLRSEGIPKLY